MKLRWLSAVVAAAWLYLLYGLANAYQFVTEYVLPRNFPFSQKLSLAWQVASQNDTWYGILWVAIILTAIWAWKR